MVNWLVFISFVYWPNGQCVYLFSLLAKWLVVLRVFIKYTGQVVRVPISLVYRPSGQCVYLYG